MNTRLWKNIALLAGIFAFVVSVLTVVNYLQLKRADPIKTETINLLVQRLNQHPEDVELRNQIRELDLLVRKAYFTNQWQIRTGGYILLICLALLIISFQMIASQQKPDPKPGEILNESFLVNQKNTRRWIAFGGGLMIITALFLTFLTNNELKTRFNIAATGKMMAAVDSVPNTIEPEVEPLISEKEATVSDTSQNTIPLQEKDTSVNQAIVSEVQTKKSVSTKAGISEKEMKKNFTSFRGFGGNGISYHKNVPTQWNGPENKNIRWKVELPLPGFNSPIIWGDKLFISGANSSKREVYCFDRLTGKIIWTATVDQIEGSPETAPEVTPDTGHAAPTLTTDGLCVYAIFSTGDLIALDMKGKRLWARNLGVPKNHYGYSSSLMLYNNKLLIQYDQNKGAKIMALDTETGETVWSTDRKVRISWASPILVNTNAGMELMLIADPLVASYNPETGEKLWEINCMSGEVGSSLVYADGIVFAMNEYASLVAIKPGTTPQILWKNDEYLSDVPSPVATDKYLFIATSYGVVVCYNAKSGEKYWEHEWNNGFYSSMMLNGNNIYLIDKKGVTHIFKAEKTFVEVSASPIGEAVFATPAFSDGNLYIRTEKNLYSIGK
jgi:outer membrane protein assembly factor BamB